MEKSPDAFRTISEVAETLGVQAHVLRFWESKFSQIKPMKRAGGRRYYRPADVDLLSGIRKLLHEDGMTIKGVQKLLRERGTAYVAAQMHDVIPAADPEPLPVAEPTPPAPAPKPTAAIAQPSTPPAASEPQPSAAPAPSVPEQLAEPATSQEMDNAPAAPLDTPPQADAMPDPQPAADVAPAQQPSADPAPDEQPPEADTPAEDEMPTFARRRQPEAAPEAPAPAAPAETPDNQANLFATPTDPDTPPADAPSAPAQADPGDEAPALEPSEAEQPTLGPLPQLYPDQPESEIVVGRGLLAQCLEITSIPADQHTEMQAALADLRRFADSLSEELAGH